MPTEEDHQTILRCKKANKINQLIHHMDIILPEIALSKSHGVQFLLVIGRKVTLED